MTAMIGCDRQPTATVTPPDSEAVRHTVIDVLHGLSSVSFVVSHPGPPTDMGGGLLLRTVNGVASFPDRAEMSATGSVQRVAVEFGIVQVGGMTYLRGPIGETWRAVDPSALPFNFNGMNLSVANALSSATSIEVAIGVDIGGTSTFLLTGRIVSNGLAGLVPAAASGMPLALKVWVRRSDLRPERVVIEGAVIAEDPPDMVRQLDLSGFNEPVAIEPPL